MNWLKERKIVRSLLALFIIAAVSFAISRSDNDWFCVFYAVILALFPDEIKMMWSKFMDLFCRSKQIRITCSYYYRIMNGSYYLLIDEHNENLYRPVGGVYKYDKGFENEISTKFEGTYDGILESIDDTENDLRLVINSRKEKDFFEWFATNLQRETITDLTREFREELVDTGLVQSTSFINKKLVYAYVGSYTRKSKNPLLNKSQRQYYDVVNVQLSNEQQKAIKHLVNSMPSEGQPSYIFVTQQEILEGSCNRFMSIKKISPAAKYLLVSGGPPLEKKAGLIGTYNPIMESSACMESETGEVISPNNGKNKGSV